MPSLFDPPPAPKSRFRAIRPIEAVLYTLILLGCALRIYNVVVHNPLDHLWSDPLRHWDHAKEPLTPSPMALFDPPVYQNWLSIVQRITMGIPGLIAAYAATLSVATPWLWYRFLRETLASKTLALAGWAALALLPTWIGIYSYFMTETLLLPALGASLWASARARRKKTVASFVGMIALWTFCGLTRPIAIPAAAFAAAIIWITHPEKLRTATWSALLLVATLTPIAIRNHNFYGLWAPHGNGWINKIYASSGAREIKLHFVQRGAHWEYGFGSPSIDSQPLAPLSNWTSQRSGVVDVNIDFEHGTRDWEKAYQANVRHGSALWRLHIENIIFLFFGNSWPDNNPDYLMGQLANFSRWLWAPLTLILLIITFLKWRIAIRRPMIPLLIVIWLFFQGWLLVVPNEGRYRKPLEGFLVVYALVLLDARSRQRSDTMDNSATTTPDGVALT